MRDLGSSLKTVTLLAALGILLLFFFPASFGSFTSTHGPTTALRAMNAIRSLFAALASKAICALLASSSLLFVAQFTLLNSQRNTSQVVCLRC